MQLPEDWIYQTLLQWADERFRTIVKVGRMPHGRKRQRAQKKWAADTEASMHRLQKRLKGAPCDATP